jgi:hypothetical protein
MQPRRHIRRDHEAAVLASMAPSWHPAFREQQGFTIGGCEERRADQAQSVGAQSPAMTPHTQPHQPRQAHR